MAKYRKIMVANDEQILRQWHLGSAAGSVNVDREEAFKTVGNSLILNVNGWHYEKYQVPGTKSYVVLAWDDHGNEIIE